MAVCAKAMKKPFYVLTESFKFSRLFPLGQWDLPEEYKVNCSYQEIVWDMVVVFNNYNNTRLDKGLKEIVALVKLSGKITGPTIWFPKLGARTFNFSVTVNDLLLLQHPHENLPVYLFGPFTTILERWTSVMVSHHRSIYWNQWHTFWLIKISKSFINVRL